MGGGGPKAPDNSAQMAELEKQKKDAQARADAAAESNLEETNALRRRRRGASLLTATNGELGTQAKIGK